MQVIAPTGWSPVTVISRFIFGSVGFGILAGSSDILTEIFKFFTAPAGKFV
jgi:hypothetical protein